VRFEKAWEYADIELEDSRVKAFAYNNIQQKPTFGSFMAEVPKAALCGPVKNSIAAN